MKILITNAWMRNLGGSELVTLELAEEFQQQGHEVLIYTHYVGGPLKLTVPHTTQKPDVSDFDLIWIHHNMLEPFKPRDSQRLVFNHMSSYVGLEMPTYSQWQNNCGYVTLANSKETACVIRNGGVKNVDLLQNPAPSDWDNVWTPGDKLLFVSNHPPKEIRDIEGIRLAGQRRITPEDMKGVKGIVCNGKSVQYALRAGCPVYLYDHFGGPGWLTEENFKRAEWFNFSGRGFDRKSAEVINQEMLMLPNTMPCPDRFKLELTLTRLEIV